MNNYLYHSGQDRKNIVSIPKVCLLGSLLTFEGHNSPHLWGSICLSLLHSFTTYMYMNPYWTFWVLPYFNFNVIMQSIICWVQLFSLKTLNSSILWIAIVYWFSLLNVFCGMNIPLSVLSTLEQSLPFNGSVLFHKYLI